ncbi:MAG: hypothetical protein ACO1RT_14310 [Planctomycetaceae bacterium]
MIASWTIAIATLWVAGGATCYRQTVKVNSMPPPQVFTSLPSLDELATVLNRTDAITQLSSNSLSVEVPSMTNVPRLSATLALDRPRQFRLRASVPLLLGSGIDLGSNDELFWFEVPEAMTQTLYFARHDQYQRQSVRSILPVDPSWLVEALGLVHLDPAQVVEGPILRTDGRLEVRSMMPYPDGLYSRVCVIEPNAGYVTDQILFGPNGKMIAGASGSNHRYYPEQQCALPHLVQVQLIPDGGPPLELKIEVGNYSLNQLLSGDPQLFTMPQTARQQVDLAALGDPTFASPGYGTPATTPQSVVPPPPRSAYAVPQANAMITDSYR